MGRRGQRGPMHSASAPWRSSKTKPNTVSTGLTTHRSQVWNSMLICAREAGVGPLSWCKQGQGGGHGSSSSAGRGN